MRRANTIITGVILCFIWILIPAYILEGGDASELGMYLLVYAGPLIIFSVLNGLFLEKIRQMKDPSRMLLSLVPLVLLLALALMDGRRILMLDADASFTGTVGLIALGITNLIWNIKLRAASKRIKQM